MNARTAGARRGWEHRREKEERVVQNLDADHVVLWERVKGSIRGGTPHERFEAFQRYAEEHPGEIIEALQEQADDMLEAQLAQRRDDPTNTIPALGKPRFVFFRGELHRITRLAHALGLGGGTLGQRVNRGWPEERWADPPRTPRRNAANDGGR